ncbi:MAG TPA: hypothetical protein DCW55_04355 [Candidatus Pacebacteria bacterium]|nr:MAG: hypothetical protein A2378_00205 [Candidatus Pacebacteria bacterium RIFOXYB1_FULL_44_10]HAU99428.1 hypothetical protein [Candidatus Paceibacterota bacterium]HAX01566.1 hypothetical protein [Candidatus Paceibacterota bacterium]
MRCSKQCSFGSVTGNLVGLVVQILRKVSAFAMDGVSPPIFFVFCGLQCAKYRFSSSFRFESFF